MEKVVVGERQSVSAVTTLKILARGGASAVMAAMKQRSLSFGPVAEITTPSPVLDTVPAIPKRQAKL
jgi:hypothetical protein